MTKDTLRIVFMGTPDFAVPSLKALVAAGFDVVGCYSQPPKPAGRGQKLAKCPVQLAAESLNIPTFTPISLKTPEAQQEFAALAPDIAVVAAYGLILPKAILAVPRLGCVNVHASLLPRWRGASPIQHAIWYGDMETGVTLMQMEAGLDTGPMLQVLKCPIEKNTTAHTLHETLATLGAQALPDLICALNKGAVTATPQLAEGVTYARLLTKDDGIIDWSKTAVEIDRQIRAFTPWPGCRSGTLKILAAEVASTETSTAPAGTLLNKQGLVACGQGSVLKLLHVQPNSAKAMSLEAALNGGYVSLNAAL